MDNDYLRVNSKEIADGIVESELIEIVNNKEQSAPTENKDSKENKKNKANKTKTNLNIFTLLKEGKSNVSWHILNTNDLLSVALTTFSFALLLLFISTISKSILFLIMSSIVISFALPFCFIVFLFELNNMKNVSVGNICISIAIGMAYYALVKLYKRPIENYFSSIPVMNFFGNVILTVIDDVLLFAIAFIMAKLFKKDCMFGTMLIVVCVFNGYSIADSLSKLLSSMFTNVNISTDSINTYTSAIISSNQFYDNALFAFLPVLFKEGFFMTILMCFWSVICGTSISSITAPLKNDSYKDLSSYSLCVSVVIMHAAITMKYASPFLSFIINFAVLVITVLISIKLLNYSLARTNYNNYPNITDDNKSAP